jgi:hypothetical protein
MRGPIQFHTKFLLPHGEADVPKRLQLQGSFALPRARFTSTQTVAKLDQLSLRASGHPKAAQEAKGDPSPSPIATRMSGDFKLNRGDLSLSQLHFQVPGAAIALAGDYHIEDRQFSFAGKVRLAAKLSQMTTGVKSFLLKAVDPFFSKQGAGTVLPIKITGTGTTPHFTLDFHRGHK